MQTADKFILYCYVVLAASVWIVSLEGVVSTVVYFTKDSMLLFSYDSSFYSDYVYIAYFYMYDDFRLNLVFNNNTNKNNLSRSPYTAY